MATEELVMDRPHSMSELRTEVPDGIKTILFHVHGDEALGGRLQVALTLARTFEAHLHLLHVTPIEAYAVTDAFGMFISSEILDVLRDEAATLRRTLEEQLAKEDVSWEYEEVVGDLMPQLLGRSSLADLVIVGRRPNRRDFAGPSVGFLGDLVDSVRTPLMVIDSEADRFDPFAAATVAWNGSFEAANALRGSLPLLKLASQVHLVSVTEAKDAAFPPIRALEYLSRHGVHAELVERTDDGAGIEAALCDQLAADRSAYLVMGAYGHSRAGEFLFGGVTRSLLKASPKPLLISR